MGKNIRIVKIISKILRLRPNQLENHAVHFYRMLLGKKKFIIIIYNNSIISSYSKLIILGPENAIHISVAVMFRIPYKVRASPKLYKV